MANFKQIQVRIWQDNWFLSLTPEEKLFWIYIITNEHSHISGLYELAKPLISPCTGIKDWEKILAKFEKDGKIRTYKDWIYIINKRKHQPISNNVRDNANISIENYFKENSEIYDKVNKPLEATSSPLKPLQPKSTTLSEIEIEIEREIERETINNNATKSVAKTDSINLVMEKFYEFNPGLNFGNKTQRKATEDLIKKFTLENLIGMVEWYKTKMSDKYCPTATTPLAFKEKIGDIKVYADKLKNNNNIVNDLGNI
jgi:hypothetical protein